VGVYIASQLRLRNFPISKEASSAKTKIVAAKTPKILSAFLLMDPPACWPADPVLDYGVAGSSRLAIRDAEQGPRFAWESVHSQADGAFALVFFLSLVLIYTAVDARLRRLSAPTLLHHATIPPDPAPLRAKKGMSDFDLLSRAVRHRRLFAPCTKLTIICLFSRAI
jgi:hypothetical protein